MFNLFRKTQQWSIYPLISCFLGAWLIVVCQFCVASANAEIESGEHAGINSPCDAPMTDENSGKPCCQESSPCEGMVMVADVSVPIPMVYEELSFDLPVFIHNPPAQFNVSHTLSLCSLYQDPEGANLLPIERFCVQLK